MPLELEIIRACEFIRAGTHGEFDLERTKPVLINLAEACRKRGINRALLDVRESTSNLTPDDLASLVQLFCEKTASHKLRLAIVHTGSQDYRAKLFVFFSAMRGRKVKAFETFEEALVWLSASDEPTHKDPVDKSKVSIHPEAGERS